MCISRDLSSYTERRIVNYFIITFFAILNERRNKQTAASQKVGKMIININFCLLKTAILLFVVENIAKEGKPIVGNKPSSCMRKLHLPLLCLYVECEKSFKGKL
jgi:hypothetical protein